MGKKKIQKTPKVEKDDEGIAHSPSPKQQVDQDSNVRKADEPQSATKVIKKKGKNSKNTSNIRQSSTDDNQLITPQFRGRIESFKGFFAQYLELRSNKGDSSSADQLNSVTHQVRSKITKACNKIFEENVSDAQQWIQGQKNKIIDQLVNVDIAEAETKKSLQRSGIFSRQQIKNHVEVMKNKRSFLEQVVKNFDDLKAKAQNIYRVQDAIQEQ